MIYLCGMKSKSKVISIEATAMMRLQFAGAENGYKSGRSFIEAILNLVAKDEGVLKGLISKIECQGIDLERKENQNGTHRKMNPTDRNLSLQENELKNAENEFVEISGGEFVISKNDKMYKDSYQNKAVLPKSVNGVGGQDACLLPVLESEVYGGIPAVKDGEYLLKDGVLFLTKNGKKGVVDIDSHLEGKEVVVLHCGERIEIDLAVKAGKI